MSQLSDPSLVVVSNRLPISLYHDPSGALRAQRGSGGLVTALRPVLGEYGGQWIGWLGTADGQPPAALLEETEAEMGCSLHPVDLTAEEVAGYYHGFANKILWPLFHDQSCRCEFDPKYWPQYEGVNEKFARAIAESSSPSDLVWVHDYHLMRVAASLRAAGVQRRTAFFLHIPFPPHDLFFTLPWRDQLIDGLLAYDLVGFQTERDLQNFLVCLSRLREDLRVESDGDTRTVVLPDGSRVTVAAVPISIDYENFVHRAVQDDVSERLATIRSRLPGQKLILGVDRLDYTKGIPHRLTALDHVLEHHPELRGEVTFLQVVVPSRTRVGEYRDLKDEIERMIGAINGKYGEAGWTPVQYVFRSLNEVELLAYYRVSDVALVTPLKDGMNLVCKEYCACSLNDDGVLVLSEFAGAAAELGDHCLLVNPHDVVATAGAIYEALTMPADRRHTMMHELRQTVQRNDISRWVERFLISLPVAGTTGAAWRGRSRPQLNELPRAG